MLVENHAYRIIFSASLCFSVGVSPIGNYAPLFSYKCSYTTHTIAANRCRGVFVVLGYAHTCAQGALMNELTHPQTNKTSAAGARPLVWAAIGAIGALSLALAGLGFSKVMSRDAANTATNPTTAIAVAPLISAPKTLAPTAKPATHHATPAADASAPTRIAQANPNLGTVQSVRAVQQKGEGTGAGAVIGGVLGGVLGHQVGGGTGKDLATVGGAIGGGVLGHQIERNVRGKTIYEVTVRMDNGAVRTFTQSSASAVGARVVAEGNTLRASQAAQT
jgi:outer membrane lipoprotein SlyB